jgi:hypothetical protein
MVKEDFTFEFDESVLFSYAGRGIEKKLRDPRNTDIFERTRQGFFKLVQPMVIWDRFRIEGYAHDKVLLGNGRKLGNGPFVGVITGAEELVAAVCTVGKELEMHARKLMKTGSMLEGIILDGLASWAVDNLRCRFYDWMKEQLHSAEGFRASTFLSPGESIWSIDDQKILFEMLGENIPENRVTLTESNVMVPFKSLSMVFGIGPNEMGSEGETNCDVCTMKDVCRFRKLRAG